MKFNWDTPSTTTTNNDGTAYSGLLIQITNDKYGIQNDPALRIFVNKKRGEIVMGRWGSIKMYLLILLASNKKL